MGSTFGYGASTNHYKDFKNARVILVEGNNPAENHPMGMKWILEAKQAGAKLVVVDPRFTRTAAHADLFVPIRPGSDIAFQGALIREVIERRWYDEAYLKRATNALFKVHPGFGFEAGAFSGLRRRGDTVGYDTSTWSYRRDAAGAVLQGRDLMEEGTVFRHLADHFSRYTPELASEITGADPGRIREVARLLGTIRPGVVMYALGATQHTIGVQQIRCYAILQLLLGNMGVPGGGVGANRGESNVQGATDMGVLWDKLPGYLPQPEEFHRSLDDYAKAFGREARAGLVNLLAAWFGTASPPADSYRLLPRVPRGKGYSLYELQDRMRTGEVRGLVVMGQNPVVSNADRRLTLESLSRLDLLVVVDIFETETSRFFTLVDDPSQVGTEVWVLPAAGFLEKPGSLTNSGRWVQGRETVVDPPGEARPDLWILDRLHSELMTRLGDRPRDRALASAIWDHREGDYQAVLREIAGRALVPLTGPDGTELEAGAPLPSPAWLRGDGTTACGNRLYAGLFAGGQDLSRRRGTADDPLGSHPDFAWSWPGNQRILYPASAERPFEKTAEGVARLFAGDFELHDRGELVRRSLRPEDGPFPEHYEPFEGPIENPLHPEVPCSPLVSHPRTAEHLELGDPSEFPHVLTTGFLHEMWGGGAMSRRLGPLAEAQPEPFVEISRGLAARLAVKNGQPVRVRTARGEITVKAMVTDRLRPLVCGGAFIEVVWIPMHYGEFGDATGPSVNALTLDVLEPNVSIQETKSCRCRVENPAQDRRPSVASRPVTGSRRPGGTRRPGEAGGPDTDEVPEVDELPEGRGAVESPDREEGAS